MEEQDKLIIQQEVNARRPSDEGGRLIRALKKIITPSANNTEGVKSIAGAIGMIGLPM